MPLRHESTNLSGPVTLAHCWSRVRRRFYEIAQAATLIDDLQAWLDAQLAKVRRRVRIAESIRYDVVEGADPLQRGFGATAGSATFL
jgi:hypothetical protein